MRKTETDEPTRSRDRAATEHALVVAARDTLAEHGFATFGVNAVARRAGCDKQLIYRYFGGLDGLIDAVGLDLAERLAIALEPLSRPAPESYAEFAERLALGLLELLRGDAILRRIAAAEVATPSPLVERLAAARSRRLGPWSASLRGALTPPDGVDAAAANAVLIAAIQQLALSAETSGAFAGAPLRSDADWERVRDTLRRVVAALYRPSAPPASSAAQSSADTTSARSATSACHR